jgi:hypothetical protein
VPETIGSATPRAVVGSWSDLEPRRPRIGSLSSSRRRTVHVGVQAEGNGGFLKLALGLGVLGRELGATLSDGRDLVDRLLALVKADEFRV